MNPEIPVYTLEKPDFPTVTELLAPGIEILIKRNEDVAYTLNMVNAPLECWLQVHWIDILDQKVVASELAMADLPVMADHVLRMDPAIYRMFITTTFLDVLPV